MRINKYINKYNSQNKLYKWRFYTLGWDQYHKCLDENLPVNLAGLRQINGAVTLFALCAAFFNAATGDTLLSGITYFITAAAALIIAAAARVLEKAHTGGRGVSSRLIYALVILFYINLMVLGLYMGVITNPDHPAVTYMLFLLCAPFLLVIPPILMFGLTATSVLVLIVSVLLLKNSDIWFLDIYNVLIAGGASLAIGWQIARLRMVSQLNANRLEEERNSLYNQSTTDELTGLKNRRDFMQTFRRFINNYRATDECLCVGILDIDFFKNYNDHYGHPQGDKALRQVGWALARLKESLGVYAARVGGEEFGLLWFENENSKTDVIVASVHKEIKNMAIPHAASKVAPYITVSFGVYISICGNSDNIQVLYELADKALYEAKKSGRNCTRIYDERLK